MEAKCQPLTVEKPTVFRPVLTVAAALLSIADRYGAHFRTELNWAQILSSPRFLDERQWEGEIY